MNETNELNQELIPGTTIPRPRNRNLMESDQEYVEYLKSYYAMYFPENEPEEIVTPITTETKVESSGVNDDELEAIYQNLESYADEVVNDESKDLEKIQTINVETDPNQLFGVDNHELATPEDDIFFDTSTDSEEVVSYTPSNNNLITRIKTPIFLNKVVNFFQSKKESILKVTEFFQDISNTLEDDITPTTARVR